ncbi:hypothetical protein [Niabella sp.]|uniref:hypothetical protein n=1 Tax=Niabella sp. TaxID=1962976 RepID=UPI00260B1C58|nr:hypothetical protein [Niabella sp.]
MNIRQLLPALALLLLTCCKNGGENYQEASSVEDDQGNLIIFADWKNADGTTKHFERKVFVKGYTKGQKDSLRNRIFDSLHVFRTQ